MSQSAILVHGDLLQVTMNPPVVVPLLVAPVPLVASGFATIDGKVVCIAGDELPPSLRSPIQYMSPPFVVPGMGKLSVSLASDHKSATAADDGHVMLLKGATFQVKLEVQVPAQQPSPSGPVPDATPSYAGTAQFISTDTVAVAE